MKIKYLLIYSKKCITFLKLPKGHHPRISQTLTDLLKLDSIHFPVGIPIIFIA